MAPERSVMTQRAFKKVELGEAKPTERHRLMADGLIHGKSCRKAAEDAGYGKTYAKCFAGRIARSMPVKQVLLELSKGIKLGELGNMAKVLLQEDLLKPPKEPKARHAVIRTGLEVDGLLGGPSELHLHQHSTLPPAVQKMLEDKMLEIMNLKQEEAITVISEGG